MIVILGIILIFNLVVGLIYLYARHNDHIKEITDYYDTCEDYIYEDDSQEVIDYKVESFKNGRYDKRHNRKKYY